MRHRKHTFKIGRTAAHRRCMIANMLKSLVHYGRVKTTLTKAKEVRRHADRLVTLAKKGTLASRRQVIADLMIQFNRLTPKERRHLPKEHAEVGRGCNIDRSTVYKLFNELSVRFATRNGGYTRIIPLEERRGDQALLCFLEYLP